MLRSDQANEPGQLSSPGRARQLVAEAVAARAASTRAAVFISKTRRSGQGVVQTPK
jgi:hypothetical protein